MPEQPAPLSILDLSPVSEGSTPAVALRNARGPGPLVRAAGPRVGPRLAEDLAWRQAPLKPAMDKSY